MTKVILKMFEKYILLPTSSYVILFALSHIVLRDILLN